MTLRDLRDESGKTLAQICEELQAIYPDAPATPGGLANTERRGIRSLPLLRALAHVYGVPLEVVEKAASRPVPSQGATGNIRRKSRKIFSESVIIA